MLNIINTILLVAIFCIIIFFLATVKLQTRKMYTVNDTVKSLRDLCQEQKLWIRYNGKMCPKFAVNSLLNKTDLILVIDAINDEENKENNQEKLIYD